MNALEQAQHKMREAGVAQGAIDVFTDFHGQLEGGATGLVREADVDPLAGIARADDVTADPAAQREAAAVTAIIKLNGGLGTSMGMDKAKSLLPVRDGLTFLDVIAGQVKHVREQLDVDLPVLFMHSFRTQDDSLAALAPHALQVEGLPLDFLQNREPKLRADDLTPVEWPADPTLEWCPPGHGDLYTALLASGVLDALIDAGYRYASVSNSDNLGAAPDPAMMAWFAGTGAPYAAEVCRRTPADVKGGHLVVRRDDGRLVLRETAQTADEDVEAATDLHRHPYFHTNNLWFDLRQVRETLRERDGVLGLPLIRNTKNVDPADPSSPEVIQIESAMGAAVEVFDGATAIEVDRSRFLPVKTTNDLLLLRSDVYGVGPDFRVRAQVDPRPLIDLDPRFFKTIDGFDARFPHTPSLVDATSLSVEGDWSFGRDVVVSGQVRLADDGTAQHVPAGTRLG
ncbi:UTP--glucose-1-phosphate uridylyltransferase [Aeromicrobium sp. CTD01-1L150]|uniref:UTP--glucose-1-phosphate uridylyltransferase n=1 Tax=Aeromicrobium sp. CTD01-1L150 TaxID=3341830 RepID=UPI0035C08266